MQSQVEPRGGFLFNVNLVFLSQIAIYGLAFGLRVLLARGLGDEGLGTYSLFFLAVLVAGGIANLGVGLSNIYFLNKGTYSYGVLLAGSLFVLAATSVLAALLARGLVGVRNVDIGGLLRPRWGVLKEQVRYGAQGQVANLAQLFNYRLDQFLVAAFVSRAGVGHYTVAVGPGGRVWGRGLGRARG